jgi:hypothetical protein
VKAGKLVRHTKLVVETRQHNVCLEKHRCRGSTPGELSEVLPDFQSCNGFETAVLSGGSPDMARTIAIASSRTW